MSECAGEVDLFIPDPAHGLLETSASLEAAFKPTTERISIERARLDDIQLPQRVSVIKVDIEGHEAAFFKGAVRTLQQDRPIVFAEMLVGAQKQFYNLSKLLSGNDYLIFRLRETCVIATSFIKYDRLAWNYAFVPIESLAVFVSCCHAHGLELFRFFEET